MLQKKTNKKEVFGKYFCELFHTLLDNLYKGISLQMLIHNTLQC